MTLETVLRLAERTYDALRTATGDSDPESHTWIKRTYLDMECDLEGRLYVRDEDIRNIGKPGAQTVACVYGSEPPTLALVNAGATEAEIEALLRECMGVDAERGGV